MFIRALLVKGGNAREPGPPGSRGLSLNGSLNFVEMGCLRVAWGCLSGFCLGFSGGFTVLRFIFVSCRLMRITLTRGTTVS